MRSLLSIVTVTLRDAVRSKLATALALFLLVLSTALPFALSGDGTPMGQTSVRLLYTSSIAMAILSLASVWMAAASISSDIRSRMLQLVRIKPVRMWKLWLGKWFAFLLLDGLLLAGALLLLCARIALEDGDSLFQAASLRIPPDLPSVEEQTELTMRMATENPALSKEEIRLLEAQIKAQIPYATATLNRDESWEWDFRLPRAIRPGDRLVLRTRLDADAITRDRIAIDCSLRSRDGGEAIPFRLDELSSRELLVPVDATPLAGRKDVVLAMHHAGTGDAGPVLLQPRQHLVLLQQAGPFMANLARSYLVCLSVLSVLLAIGLSLGALFSLPVAVFCSVGLILSVLVGRYATSDPDILEPDPDSAGSFILVATRAAAACTSRTLTALSRPTLDPSPITELAEGEWIPDDELLRASAFNFLLIPALLAIAVSIPLAGKELPE